MSPGPPQASGNGPFSSDSSPETVTDLSVTGTTDSSVTLAWTEVDDGRGSPASYEVRYALTPLGHGWGDATIVVEGDCALPLEGSQVGATISCTVNGLDPETSYDFRLAAFWEHPNKTKMYGDELSNVAAATTRTEEVPSANPANVTDLSVTGTTDNSVTLAWAEVDDGAGSPASYEVRYALTPIGHGWGAATTVIAGNCASPVTGSDVGATISCAVGGLDPATGYDFQLVAFRDEEDGSRVFSDELSNVATATTRTEEVPSANPSNVTDLSVSGTSDNSVTLAWAEVNDGTGSPASYQVRYALTPIGDGWNAATTVIAGNCASPVTGSEVGATISCAVNGLESATGYDFQLVAFRDEEDGTRVYSDELSNVATTTTTTEEAPIANPSNVTDLSVSGTSDNSVTLAWAEANDGTGSPASYQVRYALTPIGHGWGDATAVIAGECASPITGSHVGATISCTVNGLDSATDYDFQLVAFRDEEDGSRVFSDELSNVATATTTTTTEEAPIANPSNVTDLSVSGTSDNSVTLAWAEVNDGTGSPASYQVRYALTPIGHGWGDATAVIAGECASPITGSHVGATISCTVNGLDSATGYDFQLVAFRDEEDGSRVFSDELSNVATATTEEELTTSDSPEPAGFSVLAETTYSSANEGGFRSSENENFDIVDDAGAPRSPSKVARATFPAGLGDGVSPIWSEAVISSHSARQVYVSFWIKISDNWQGHSTGVNKVAIIWTHEKPVVVANILGAGDGWLGSEIRIQDVPDGARNLAPNLTNPEIVRDRWHHWEILLVSNVEDSADGEIHWWVDGTKVGAYADVRFGTASQSKIWNYVNWRPVWGGRGDVIEETQYMWMDHYYVSGKQ